MMQHRPSLPLALCLLCTTSSNHIFGTQISSVASSESLGVSSIAQPPPKSCHEAQRGLQSTVLADKGDLLLMTSVSQVRKPQEVSTAISEEILREIVGSQQHDQSNRQSIPPSINSSLLVPKANESKKSWSTPSHTLFSGQRISSGVAPNGDLAQVDSILHTQQPFKDTLDADPPEAEALVQKQHLDSPRSQKHSWPRSKQVLEFVQTMLLERSQSFGEGVMLFILCNIFLCALVSGICLMWNRHADSDDIGWPGDAKAVKKRQAENQGIGALEERRSHALVQKQAPSARSSATNARYSSNGGQKASRTPDTLHTPSGPARQLCPELVVPLGSECILAVRCLVSSQTQQCDFEVLDINGKAVLRVEVSPNFSVHSRHSNGPAQRTPTITLKALQPRETTGGMVLAYCQSHLRADDGWSSNSGKRNVCIYNDSDELFAHIVKDEARHRYVLTSGRPGLQLLFEGNFEERAVDVANEARELLAATEPAAMPFDPSNKYYKLRVAADVDVGLVLCGLLAIDQIEIK